VNSSYAYLLWVRDFSESTAVAEAGGDLLAFCTGYLRPDSPSTYFVWQVAVDPLARGAGLARAVLEEVVDHSGATRLEATVTADNEASNRLFSRFAERRRAPLVREELFTAADFPDEHPPEQLLRIGPF